MSQYNLMQSLRALMQYNIMNFRYDTVVSEYVTSQLETIRCFLNMILHNLRYSGVSINTIRWRLSVRCGGVFLCPFSHQVKIFSFQFRCVTVTVCVCVFLQGAVVLGESSVSETATETSSWMSLTCPQVGLYTH